MSQEQILLWKVQVWIIALKLIFCQLNIQTRKWPASVAQLDACLTGDQEEQIRPPSGQQHSFVIMKYFLRSFSLFR